MTSSSVDSYVTYTRFGIVLLKYMLVLAMSSKYIHAHYVILVAALYAHIYVYLL